jgi:hypothetical protein
LTTRRSDAAGGADRDNARVTATNDALPADLLLAEGTRLVHIGPHKTGTTTLQGAFHAARRAVESQGVHYASPWNRQAMQAARAVAGARSPFGDGAAAAGSHWTDLVREVERSTAGRVLVSAEGFADATPATIRRLSADLGPARIHVVATLRPLGRILPSQWQQYVQNGLTLGYDAWLHSVFDTPERPATPSFWHRHRHDRLLERWADVVGAERVTAVVVDDRDHDAALRVFERLLGLRVGTLVRDERTYNRSLTRAEIELVRAIQAAAAGLGIHRGLRVTLARHGIAANLKLREPDPAEPRIVTSGWAQERVRTISREIVDGIAASGIRVIGDLDLLVEGPPGTRAAGTARNASRESEAATDDAVWAAVAGRALMGIVVQSGLARGSGATAGPADWPDDAVAARARPGGLPALEYWSTPRLRSLVAGRIRAALRSGFSAPFQAAKRARGTIGGDRAVRSRRPRTTDGRAVNPPIHSASMPTTRREATEVEETEPE